MSNLVKFIILWFILIWIESIDLIIDLIISFF